MPSAAIPPGAAEPLQARSRNTVTVLLFALAAEHLGADRLEFDLFADETAGSVERRLRALPGGDRLPPRTRIAVNQRFAAPEQRIEPGDEIAVIPPVAGG